MSQSSHQLIRSFFAALSKGDLADALFTDDATVWTLTSGTSEKTKYQSGVKLLQSLFPNGLTYHIQALTAEDDRVAAEVQGKGTLKSGEVYHNFYVFLFRVRDGRIASVAEYFNPLIVQAKLAPLFQAAMSKQSG